MSRLWLGGLPIDTIVVNELPQSFIWHKHQHKVVWIISSWRLNQGWWIEHVWRDYYQLVTDTQLLVEIYHDLNTDTWALQRLYD